MTEPEDDQYILGEIETTVSFERPPLESYEVAWRTSVKALEEAGPGAGFALCIVKNNPQKEDTFLSEFYVSSGTERINVDDLNGIVKAWLDS
jgi:hypothetical protein